jgi:hypothetical protein
MYEKAPKSKLAKLAEKDTPDKAVVRLESTGNVQVMQKSIAAYRRLGYDYVGEKPGGIVEMAAPGHVPAEIEKKQHDLARERAKSVGAPLPVPVIRQDVDIRSVSMSKGDLDKAYEDAKRFQPTGDDES